MQDPEGEPSLLPPSSLVTALRTDTPGFWPEHLSWRPQVGEERFLLELSEGGVTERLWFPQRPQGPALPRSSAQVGLCGGCLLPASVD